MSSSTISTMLQRQIKIGLLREMYRQNLLSEEQYSQLIKRQRN